MNPPLIRPSLTAWPDLRRRLARAARIAVGAALLLGCAKGPPDTGAQIEVVNGDGVLAPQYLLFDWSDSDSVLVHDRRVPETGLLNPAARPLAVVRIAADAVTDPERHITVRGIVGERVVSQGEGAIRIMAGTWQATTVTLQAGAPPDPDAGAPPDGAPDDGDAGLDPDAAPDDAGDDGGSPDPDTSSVPPDGSAPPDLPSDPRPDLPRDLAPDGAPSAVALSAVADSFVEQGQTSAPMNFGKGITLEVKSQNGGDNNRIAFFRFSLTALAGTVPLTATLHVYGKSSTGTSADSAYAVLDESWTETTINWNNKPALGMKQSTVNVGTTAQYRDWNVLPFVKAQLAAGRDNVNLAISMDGDTTNAPDTFNSREAASNQPQLVITR